MRSTQPLPSVRTAAEIQDEKLLQDALSSVCIDFEEEGYYSAISILARKKNVAAVNFLLQRNASSIRAIAGYAMGGHKKEATELLDKVKSERPSLVPFILPVLARGAAFNGEEGEAYQYLDTIKTYHPAYIKRTLKLIASGFALNKSNREDYITRVNRDYPAYTSLVLGQIASELAEYQKNEIESFLTYVRNNHASSMSEVVGSIVYVFSQSGDQISINKLLSQFPAFETEILINKILGLAKSNSIEEMYICLDDLKHNHCSTFSEILKDIPHQLSVCGNKSAAFAFLAKIAREKEHPEKVVSLILQAMAMGFVSGGHKEAVDELLEKTKRDYSFSIPEVLIAICSRMGEINIGGNDTKAIEAFLAKVKNEYSDHINKVFENVFEVLTMELVKNGRKVEAYLLLEKARHESSAIYQAILQGMVRGFAFLGNMAEVYKLFNGVEPEKKILVKSFIKVHLREGGHTNCLTEFNTKFPSTADDNLITSHITVMTTRTAVTKESSDRIIECSKDINPQETQSIDTILGNTLRNFFENNQEKEFYPFLEKVEKHFPTHYFDFFVYFASLKQEKGGCVDKARVLEMLTKAVGTNFFKQFVEKLELFVNYPLTDLISKATYHSERMKVENISYHQSLGWSQPEIQILLMQGMHSKLNMALPLIAPFISPMSLSEFMSLSTGFRNRFFPKHQPQASSESTAVTIHEPLESQSESLAVTIHGEPNHKRTVK